MAKVYLSEHAPPTNIRGEIKTNLKIEQFENSLQLILINLNENQE